MPDTDTETDPLLAAFANLQQRQAESPNFDGDPQQGLLAKARAIQKHLAELISPQPPAGAREAIVALLRSLSWPVKLPDGTVELRPLLLTLEREDIIRRLWRQDSSETERDRRWHSDAKIVFYCALHDHRTYQRFYSDINAQLADVHRFYREQIATYQEKDLMDTVTDALWDGHTANMATAAPAPFGAHTTGN